MKIKTSELEGAALDWAVAKSTVCDDVLFECGNRRLVCGSMSMPWGPSVKWEQGGLLIDRHKLEVGPSVKWFSLSKPWFALTPCGAMQYGPTPLIAAMRAIVASELGDTVDVPEELLS